MNPELLLYNHMSLVQRLIERVKVIVPNRRVANLGLRFVWQMLPITMLVSLYYTSIEFLPQNDAFYLDLYDLKVV